MTEEKIKAIVGGGGHEDWFMELEEFVNEAISTQRIKLLNEVREMIEGMRKTPVHNWDKRNPNEYCLDSQDGCSGCDDVTYNHALDDLLQAITKLEEEGK
jgi:hypothetical protein